MMSSEISQPAPKLLDSYANFLNSYDSVNRKVAKGRDTQQLYEMIEKVVEKATIIEESQVKILKESKFLGLSPHVWKWINRGVSGFSLFSITVTAASSILTARYQNSVNCNQPDVVIGLSTTAAGLAFGSTLVSWIYSNLTEKKIEKLEPTERNLNHVRAIKMFLLAYLEFIKSSNDNAYNQCIDLLKNNESLELSKMARDRWVSAMIQILPDGHELKSLLTQQQELAEQKLTLQKELESKRILKLEEENPIMGSPYLDRRPSAVEAIEEEKDLPYSFSEDDPAFNDSPTYLQDRTTTRLHHSDSRVPFNEERDDTADIKKKLQVIEQKFTKNHEDLCKRLALDIKECNLKGLWFKESGEVSKVPFKNHKQE